MTVVAVFLAILIVAFLAYLGRDKYRWAVYQKSCRLTIVRL